MSDAKTLTATVTLDPQNQTLTVEPRTLPLDGAQNVLWRFRGLPPDSYPGLRFEGPSLYGPFTQIRRQPDAVWGLGNTGITGVVAYIAVVGNDQGTQIESPPVQVDNQSPARLTALQLTVSVDLATQSFAVVPFDAQLLPGGTVLWRFVNLPAGYAPAIRFKRDPPASSAEPAAAPPAWLGPFDALSRSDHVIVGSGQTRTGRFTYDVEVVSKQGNESQVVVLQPLQSGDPIIDSEGEPPDEER